MNGISFSIHIEDGASEFVANVRAAMERRAGLNAAIGHAETALVKEHLRKIGLDRHDTAERLGAPPSGHWGQAVEKTFMHADESAAVVSINQPGIGRAAHDVDIHPEEGKYLTIPLIAEAYNQRAYRVEGLFFVRPKGKDYALLGKREKSPRGKNSDYNESGDGIERALGSNSKTPVTWWYLLVTDIHQQQDRSLLPSEAEFQETAREAVRIFFDYLGVVRETEGRSEG